jgi:trk system potassium uptake protein TrkA
LHGADVEVLEFEVPPNAKIIGKTLNDLKFPKNAVVGGVVRNSVGRIPDSNFEFEEKDHIVVLSKMQCIHKVESYFK